MTGAIATATAVTMGEPAGIGAEITLKAWQARKRENLAPFFVVGDPDHLASSARCMAQNIAIAEIASPIDAIAAFPSHLPVVREPLRRPATWGQPDVDNASAVLSAIDRVVAFTRAGDANAIVTNPIQKATLNRAGFAYSGHTDYLGHLAGDIPTVMMLAADTLKVIPVTVHVGLREAIAALSTDSIVRCGEIAAHAMRRDYGIAEPRIAVAGLNPHAGEDGMFGAEEDTIIRPAVAALNNLGIDAAGPLAADSLFHAAARRTYDVVLCMYHDQALIPIKTLAFDRAVNVTLGLPFVRTSPDHGTALDIAGKNVADPTSFIEAVRLAQAMARTRSQSA